MTEMQWNSRQKNDFLLKIVQICLFNVFPPQYLVLLLCIFLLELIAGLLAYIKYQEVKCPNFFFHIHLIIDF